MAAPIAPVPVSAGPGDRLTFTLFVAAAIHAALVLGVTFAGEDRPATSPTLEVTLATHADAQAPDDADFLAQHNQIGSGTLDERQDTTTDREAEIHDTEVRDVRADMPVPATPG